MADDARANKAYIGLNCIKCGTKRKTGNCLLRAYNVIQSRWGRPELKQCDDCYTDSRLQDYLDTHRPSEIVEAEYTPIRDRFLSRPTTFSTWLREAAPILKFGEEAEEMIGHAICALETISTWSETSSAASPAQHLAWSNEIITKMRDNNIVDVSVLVGYILHLLYHVHMGHWVTNVSLICSIIGMASASGLHLKPSTRRLSVWDSVPPSAHPLLARLFWYIRSLQCQIHFSSVASWPVLLAENDIELPLEVVPYGIMSPNQLYTTVALRLGAVHDLRTRSNGDLSLDDIKGLRQDLGNLLREIGLQMAERHDSKQKLAFMTPLIFAQTGLLILYGLVQGSERPLEMIDLVDAISEIGIAVHAEAVWLVSELEQGRLSIPDVDIYVCWCLFAVHQVVISQIDYLEHVNFPLARELWETIAGTLRTAIKTLAKDQPIAQALSSMSENASDSASSSVSTASTLPISVNELLLDVFAERLEQAKRSSRFLEP